MRFITKHPDGWIVRIHYPRRTVVRSFCRGGRAAALANAMAFVSAHLHQHPRRAWRFKTRAQKNSKSGIRGVSPCVSRKNGRDYHYWAVPYKDGNGLWKNRRFKRKADAVAFRRQFEKTIRPAA